MKLKCNTFFFKQTSLLANGGKGLAQRRGQHSYAFTLVILRPKFTIQGKNSRKSENWQICS